MAHSVGDEGKARAAYLKFRAEQITRDISAARKAALIERGKVVAHDALLRTRTVLKKALVIAAILFVWLIICVAISAYNESR